LKNYYSISEHVFTGGREEFAYKLRISKRAKNVQLQVTQQGEVQLVLPHSLRTFNHSSFIHSKYDWILKHTRLKQNNKFLYLGQPIAVESNYDLFAKKISYNFDSPVLCINIPSTLNHSLIHLFNNWLHIRALDYITRRCIELSQRHFLIPEKIVIRRQKTRWGSCSGNRALSFNFKLMMLRIDIIDYVIVHELCHLKELNHSSNFWHLVEEILPDYKQLRKELKQSAI